MNPTAFDPPEQTAVAAETPSVAGAVWAAVLGLCGAWAASGAMGLLAHPLRRGLCAAALVLAVLVGWAQGRRLVEYWPLALGAVLGAAMIASALAPVNVLAPVVVLLGLSRCRQGEARAVLQVAAEAVLLLASYRTALVSVPVVWLLADGLGWVVGGLAGTISQRPLWLGASFAGLDYLVVMGYLAVAVPLRGAGSKLRGRAMRLEVPVALGASLVCHLGYLVGLSFAPVLRNALPESKAAEGLAIFNMPSPTLLESLRDLVPWNMPVLAAVMHGVLAAVLWFWFVRRSARVAQGTGEAPHGRSHPTLADAKRRFRRKGRLGPGMVPRATEAARAALGVVGAFGWVVLLAALPPVLATLYPVPPLTRGKKVVLYEKGFLNWLKPQHGQYGRLSIGMYGMMPTYLHSLGMTAVISSDLSASDLQGADAVVLFFPNEPWQEGQLERLWRFVEEGGTLLVVGEHTIMEEDGGSRFNDVLAPTAMRVRFDSATFAVGGWLHSYEALAHPAAAGIPDQQNDFGVVIGASVEVRWPARPLLAGRWGWADLGDPDNKARALMGNNQYDSGEKLGDLLLAAEQRLGKGRVVVFGDTSGFTNGITVGCHEYTSRLFGYLVDPRAAPWFPVRSMAALVGLLLLAAVVVWGGDAWRGLVAATFLAGSLAACTGITHWAWNVLPDGRTQTPNNLAYIDTSHLSWASAESWRPNGLGGLTMTFMRDGFLTLNLKHLDAERLQRARFLVSVAPARPYTRQEREIIRQFVAQGGVFIITVGYEQSEASRQLLQKWGFYVGRRPNRPVQQAGGSAGVGRAGVWTPAWPPGPYHQEPRPLGHFKSPYFNSGQYLAFVRFHAGWPVFCDDPQALVLTFYPPHLPLVIIRRYEQGLVVVVGDTDFATNKNLENEGGEPFEGMRENAVFWRYLISLLRDGMGEGPIWYPPKPEVEPAPGSATP